MHFQSNVKEYLSIKKCYRRGTSLQWIFFLVLWFGVTRVVLLTSTVLFANRFDLRVFFAFVREVGALENWGETFKAQMNYDMSYIWLLVTFTLCYYVNKENIFLNIFLNVFKITCFYHTVYLLHIMGSFKNKGNYS